MNGKQEDQLFTVIVLEILENIVRRLDNMAVDLTALTAEVAAVGTVEQSAITLINGIAAQIAAAVAAVPSADPATQTAINALTAQLTAETAALSAAVTANTPVVAAPVANVAPVVAAPVVANT